MRKRRRKGLSLIDSELGVKARALADGLGIDLEDLTRALVAAGGLGETGTPISAELMSLKDAGGAIFERMKESVKCGGSMPALYRALVPWQRETVLVHLADEFTAPIDIAAKFSIEVPEVMEAWRKHATKIGELIGVLPLEAVVGTIVARVDRISQYAMEPVDGKRDLRTALSAVEFLAGFFQDVGVVRRSPTEVHHTISVDAESELERIVQLRMQARLSNGGGEVSRGATGDPGGSDGAIKGSPDRTEGPLEGTPP